MKHITHKKILVTTSTYPRWKGDTVSPFIHDLCKQMATHGLDIVILAPHSKNANKMETVEGIKVYR